MHSITDLPSDCCLIPAELIKPGDRVRFPNPRSDYTVEVAERDNIGHVRHRANNGTMTCGYHPAELLWITRRTGNGLG